MNDPKLNGVPILRPTLCRMSNHAFPWTAGSGRTSTPPPTEPHDPTTKCRCGSYTWAEWREVLAI